MNFRTEINLEKSLSTINHFDNILTIGSCFAENIAEYFKANRFNVFGNPFGVLYNPISIFNSLKFAVEKAEFEEKDLVFHQSEWHSFYHHSDFSSDEKNIILKKINDGIIKTNQFLKLTDTLIITFGTSYVYKYLANGIIASNCHKIPQKEFEYFRLTLDETTKTIIDIIEMVEIFNPKIKIIFTVSPVRHWKNGAHNNQLSKANLLLAIDEAIKSKSNCCYFPSYEIVLDDLRDYRFYNSDLVHPNKIATDYIWEKLYNSICSEECLKTISEISKIVAARNHRVRNINSVENQKFLHVMITKIGQLQNKYPYLNLNEDLNYFKSQII
ncbi:MAG: GSCFA domain-containing protein [Bacteroidetes bacterium]|nr:GSCFA domain-containing protein [Bacteroidota bacterium]MBU1116026.1 GSCFA domain-containing protein [Bacteroidota bacterium]MBU1799206.1 GSCFA domain-containing protein [Bacteroidota bacterium]